jgi:hypothetical protein
MGFIQAHGGFVAAAVFVLALYNIVMSALAQIFAKLNKPEPGFLNTATAWGLKATQWLSGNTPTPTQSGPVTTKPTTPSS